MQYYECDGCGRRLEKRGLRYTVTIDVRAAYDTMEVTLLDLVRNHRDELLRLIERLGEKGAEDLEAQVYKKLSLDLCPKCQRAYLEDPLRFQPEQAPEAPPATDVDSFLRSLGYGGGQPPADEA